MVENRSLETDGVRKKSELGISPIFNKGVHQDMKEHSLGDKTGNINGEMGIMRSLGCKGSTKNHIKYKETEDKARVNQA